MAPKGEKEGKMSNNDPKGKSPIGRKERKGKGKERKGKGVIMAQREGKEGKEGKASNNSPKGEGK